MRLLHFEYNKESLSVSQLKSVSQLQLVSQTHNAALHATELNLLRVRVSRVESSHLSFNSISSLVITSHHDTIDYDGEHDVETISISGAFPPDPDPVPVGNDHDVIIILHEHGHGNANGSDDKDKPRIRIHTRRC